MTTTKPDASKPKQVTVVYSDPANDPTTLAYEAVQKSTSIAESAAKNPKTKRK